MLLRAALARDVVLDDTVCSSAVGVGAVVGCQVMVVLPGLALGSTACHMVLKQVICGDLHLSQLLLKRLRNKLLQGSEQPSRAAS